MFRRNHPTRNKLINQVTKYKVGTYKKYCSDLLKESTVVGIPSIIISRGWFRKFIKFLIFCFGVAGFLVQTHEFLDIFWEYSTVSVQKKMTQMKMPAITICDKNIICFNLSGDLSEPSFIWLQVLYLFLWSISRRRVCENMPDMCKSVQDCSQYCNDLEDIYLMDVDFDIQNFPEDFFNINFTKENGFQIDENLSQCEWISQNENSMEISTTSCGEPEFVRAVNENKLPAACYALKSSKFDETLQADSMLRMYVRWHISDYIKKYTLYTNGVTRKYQIDFHHPGYASNPFLKGVTIQNGYSYKVTLTQIDTISLPPPYTTKCYDYEKQWKKNNYTGPLGQEDCQRTCEVNLNFENYGCVPRLIDYPHDKTLCIDYKPPDMDLNEKVRKCMENCREACTHTKYLIDSQIAGEMSEQIGYERVIAPASVAILEVVFDNLNSKTVTYRPKYESVELFSYIGGYLMMWLGWSLISVFDFVEILINMCLYPFIARKTSKTSKIF